MHDIIIQPGSKTAGPPMPNAMVCYILEGEMRIVECGLRRRLLLNEVYAVAPAFCYLISLAKAVEAQQ